MYLSLYNGTLELFWLLNEAAHQCMRLWLKKDPNVVHTLKAEILNFINFHTTFGGQEVQRKESSYIDFPNQI